jgi:polyisoprenoid-binding protein YceI
MFKPLLVAGLALIIGAPSFAADYDIDYGQTTVSFAGNHAGTDFVGTFGEWSGSISFDPDAVASSVLRAEFTLGTVKTGIRMYDGTLPTTDWFDIDNTPTAVYQSASVVHVSDTTYRASGTLTLRGFVVPVEFDFVLDDPTGDTVHASAEMTVLRLDFDIGKASDPAINWVTDDIVIKLEIVATKAD